MKLVKSGIVIAATAALIGGAAFAAPSFAVDSVESEPTQSQELRQLHKAERSGERSAERSADCDHTEAEKAAHRAERQAEREAAGYGQGKRMGAKGKGPRSDA